MKFFTASHCVFLLVGLGFTLSLHAEEPVPPLARDILVDGAYVYLPVPGRNVSAAYFTLTNTGTDARQLVAVETTAAGRAEIHSHSQVDGVMRMRREAQVTLPAEGKLEFEQGGLHVMLFELEDGLQTGQELHLTLKFSDGSQLPFAAKAKSRFDRPHH